MSARRHRTRSIITRLVVFVLLGAVVNVAVAWGLLYLAPRIRVGVLVVRQENSRPISARVTLTATERRLTYEYSVPETRIDLRHTLSLGVKYVHSTIPNENRTAAERVDLIIVGWPAAALRTTWEATDIRPAHQTPPATPLWPGFAINTFFYATILCLLFAFAFALRHWRRIRRGLCVKCAYPVGTSDVCTECGAHINKKFKARGSRGLPSPAPPAGGASTP